MDVGDLPLRSVVADALQDLVLESADVEEFLHELARYSAETLARPGRAFVWDHRDEAEETCRDGRERPGGVRDGRDPERSRRRALPGSDA